MLTTAKFASPLSNLVRREVGVPSMGAHQLLEGHELPSGIEAAARNLALAFEDATSDGGTLLKSLRPSTAIALGRVLLRQPMVQLTARVEPVDIGLQPYSEAVQWIKEATRLPMNRIAQLLGVTRPTIYAWLNNGEITDLNRRRLFTVREILERAQRLNHSPAELSRWLDSPRTEEGHTPFSLLANGEFNRARLFAISTPSPRVKTPPPWTSASPSSKHLVRPEYVAEALPPEDDELTKLLNDESEA